MKMMKVLILLLPLLWLSGCVSKGVLDELKALQKKDGETDARLRQQKPGMAEIMNFIQARHARLYYAGQAGNWKLAEHQLKGIQIELERAASLYDKWEEVPKPLSTMIPLITKAEIDKLSETIKAEDKKQFIESFERFTKDCNTCHNMTRRGFIVIQVPSGQGYGNLKYDLPKP